MIKSGWKALIGRFGADRGGIAAVEFAIITPLLLSMYFVTLEVALGVETNKKVSRVASMVADLVTQQQTLYKADLDAVNQIGEATLQPYYRSKPTIEITAIEITDETTPKVQVVWSRKLSNGLNDQGDPKGTAVTVPDVLKVKGTFLIRVKSSLAYKPVITWAAADKPALGLAAAFAGINMGETYYLRPRMSPAVKCLDC